jgi:hypothetical protein
MLNVSCDHYLIERLRLFAVIAVFVFVAGIAGVAGAGSSQMGTEFTSEGKALSGLMPADKATASIMPGSEQFDNQSISSALPGQTFSYLTVAGTAFTSRAGATTIYAGGGCIYSTSSNNLVQARLDLPQDTVIKYIRLLYYDADASNDLTAYLTSYDVVNFGGVTDQIFVNSTGSAGYGYVVSGELTLTADNLYNAYMLIALMPNSSNVQLCGIRVAYYLPNTMPYLIIR